MLKLIFFALSLLVLSSCQLTQTRVTRESPVQVEASIAKKLLQDKPVILDVRPAFQFNLAHAPGSINVRWEDFSQSHPNSRGLLQTDLFTVARRLSLIGIDRDTSVVVMGLGSQGAGEEGRVAWTLKVLGVKKVHTLLSSSYREVNEVLSESAPLVKNKPYWKPAINESLMITAKDFKMLVIEPPAAKPVVIDVRSLAEFNLRNISSDKRVKASVQHISWKDFFTNQGLPSKAIEKELMAKGINKDTSILLISNHGVRSGAATYALDYLGYKNVRNFAGGYEQWK